MLFLHVQVCQLLCYVIAPKSRVHKISPQIYHMPIWSLLYIVSNHSMSLVVLVIEATIYHSQLHHPTYIYMYQSHPW